MKLIELPKDWIEPAASLKQGSMSCAWLPRAWTSALPEAPFDPLPHGLPDRKGSDSYLRFGDGPYVFTGGWASVLATHSSGGWLAMPATGKRVAMRVMDFYRVAPNGRIAENWVPIDVTDVLRRIGFDVFARLHHLRGQARESL